MKKVGEKCFATAKLTKNTDFDWWPNYLALIFRIPLYSERTGEKSL